MENKKDLDFLNKDPKTSSVVKTRDNQSLANEVPLFSKKRKLSAGIRKNLRQGIRDLESEINEFQSNEDSKLYGLTPKVERAVKKAIEEDNGPRLYRLVRPLHPADFADLIVAGFFGTMIPIAFERFKLVPAIASSVFVTTVTAVVGFYVFLGLSAFFLM